MPKLGDQKLESSQRWAELCNDQHGKQKNATHVSAQKHPTAADGGEVGVSLNVTQWSSRRSVRLFPHKRRCQRTMSGGFRYPQRKLDRCHLPSHPTYSDMIHPANPPSPLRDWRSHITKEEFHSNPQPQWTKQKRGSGAACDDSCIKRISRLMQPANVCRTRSFTIIYNRRARWQSITLVQRTVRYYSPKSCAGLAIKHPCVDNQAPKITHEWKRVVATDHSSCDSNFG